MSWYVIRTSTRREVQALKALQELRIQAYLPMEDSWTRHARKVEAKRYPLLPGYLFAYLPTDGAMIAAAHADAVHCIVSFGGRPQRVSAIDVGLIAAQEGLGVFDRTRGNIPQPMRPTTPRKRRKMKRASWDRDAIMAALFGGSKSCDEQETMVQHRVAA